MVRHAAHSNLGSADGSGGRGPPFRQRMSRKTREWLSLPVGRSPPTPTPVYTNLVDRLQSPRTAARKLAWPRPRSPPSIAPCTRHETFGSSPHAHRRASSSVT